MPSAPTPFLIRIAHGDIVDAQASMVVVSHMNDVAPTGAEKAVDDLLGGAIGRRSGTIRGSLGDAHFLPTVSSPIATGCVLVVCLGDAEALPKNRLGEVGAAIVEAAAAIGARDAATVTHGATWLDLTVREAACRMVTGALEAVDRIPGGHTLRELTIVEFDPASVPLVVEGVMDARASFDLHVYVREEPLVQRRTVVARRGESAGGAPPHLRLGLSRAGPYLKVNRIGDDAFDRACICPFPDEAAERLPVELTEALHASAAERPEALRAIGEHLFDAFLGAADLDAARLLAEAPGDLVVLRLDEWTTDLPWELLWHESCGFLARGRRVARQLELTGVDRSAAFPKPSPRLRALVIGDPTNDLPEARREAEAVAAALRGRAGAEVCELIGGVSYETVSDALDEHSFDVLHYAGHADFVPGREDASGLTLRDQMLTVEDLKSRDSLPRLVVANACYSAASNAPADLYGGSRETRALVDGLLTAGVRAFIGARWQVGDAAAATFAAEFYEAVAPVGAGCEPIGEAVRRGREAVAREHREQEASWAAYSLYGSPWKLALETPA